MKKYTRRTRRTNKAHARQIAIHEARDRRDAWNIYAHIHITPRYDSCNRANYIADVYRKTRDTHAQTYTSVTNVMREIFPEMDAHTGHVHRATAEYRKFIPQQTNYTRPKEEYTRTVYECERVKCIIYNDELDMIYFGILRRSIYINNDSIEYMLHKGDRSIRVKKFIPFTDEINGVNIKEIMKHGIEIYRI